MTVRKRPRDPNQLGKLIIDIATGQVESADDGDPSPSGRPTKAKRVADDAQDFTNSGSGPV